jgi:hypothetical protein
MKSTTNLSFGRVAGIRRPTSIAAGAGRCRLAHQLHNLEQSARSRVKKIPVGQFKRSVATAQLALVVQRLRNQHLELCPDCGHQDGSGFPRRVA